MRETSRREFVGAGLAAISAGCARSPSSGIRVREVGFRYEDYRYRTPIKFGGLIVDRVTLLNVDCVVEAAGGRGAKGFGSMPMGNIWSFPSRRLPYETTLGAMKALADRISKITSGYGESGHPIDINRALESQYLKAAEEVAKEQNLAEPIPKLCTLVTASPFDAAIHDAFGKLQGRNCFLTYGPDLMQHDLGHYLGPEFKGEFLDRYVLKKARPHMPLYHLVGALDPITGADIRQRINDGLPETLPEWIDYNGLTHLKIKLNGDDLKWDVERVLSVHRTAEAAGMKQGVGTWYYSLDFNERCKNVDYLLAFLHQLNEKAPQAFGRVQYIEQPTARALQAHRENVMHEASKLKPVVIDESLTDLESLMLARQMGYTGAALKACKGQSQVVLMAAAAQKYKMFLCVQDLTCPGASLIHSAGLAAHIPGVAAVEANARQYVPAANKAWEREFPGVFVVKDGMMDTSALDGPGLSVVA
jgi:L-alanine-DL-glutamate epimerase-like enolase superfamily enzyme